MKTYPIVDDDGVFRGFEIELPISNRPVVRVLRSIDGVTEVTKTWFNDDRIKFLFNGEPFVVNEPYGDNSRYWIGPAEPPSPQDISPIHNAFQAHRYLVPPRVVLWGLVAAFVGFWLYAWIGRG
jgi:hypothetical protein